MERRIPMRINENKLRKIFIFLIALSVWLYWDLSQAYDNRSNNYKSFVLNSEMKTVATPPTTVSIVRSNDPAIGNPCGVTDEGITYTTIYQMVQRAVNLAGGLSSIIKTGDTVLIKPNIVQQDSSGSGGVTDIRVVKALVYLVDAIDHKHIKIIVGDGSPRPYTTFEKASGTTAAAWTQLFDVPGYQQLKTDALADSIDFRLSNLNGNSDTKPWSELDSVNIPGDGNALPQGGHYYIHQDVTHATVYITVPVLKIHNQPGYTGALKNQIGLAASTRYGFNKTTGVKQESYYHKLLHLSQAPYQWQDKEIVDLCILAKIKFAVVDAITCLQTEKTPEYNSASDHISTHIKNRVKMNTIIAGVDPVAVDNVCCRLIGLNPDDIEHITLAERNNLGTNDSSKITIVGANLYQNITRFKKGLLPSSQFGQSNRNWILNGPYPIGNGVSPIDTQYIPNEATVSPTPGTNGWSQSVYFINDRINLANYYQEQGVNTDKVVCYAFAYFNAPRNQQAELWVGSDEDLEIYINGSVVYNYKGTRSFTPDPNNANLTSMWIDTPIVSIKKGENTILVKSLQTIGRYDFSMNICEVESDMNYRGNRVMGLKFVATGTGTGVNDKYASAISSFELKNNYPNPFNPTTTITFQLAKAGSVSLRVYDITGRVLATLVDGEKAAGSYSVPWTASNISSGVYFYKLTAGNFSQVKKMVLMK
jgi:uncharacterized protein (DUF362 family)